MKSYELWPKHFLRKNVKILVKILLSLSKSKLSLTKSKLVIPKSYVWLKTCLFNHFSVSCHAISSGIEVKWQEILAPTFPDKMESAILSKYHEQLRKQSVKHFGKNRKHHSLNFLSSRPYDIKIDNSWRKFLQCHTILNLKHWHTRLCNPHDSLWFQISPFENHSDRDHQKMKNHLL